MSWEHETHNFINLAIAFLISTVSGFISISRRILAGHSASLLWIISEFLMAILCGYLMYYTFPTIEGSMPEWVNMPVAIAFAAHVGGRVFQEMEAAIYRKYGQFFRRKEDMPFIPPERSES